MLAPAKVVIPVGGEQEQQPHPSAALSGELGNMTVWLSTRRGPERRREETYTASFMEREGTRLL